MSRKVEVAALTSLRSTGLLLGSPAAATTALASDTSALSRVRGMEDGGCALPIPNFLAHDNLSVEEKSTLFTD